MMTSWLDRAGLSAADAERIRRLAERSDLSLGAAARRLGLLSDLNIAKSLAETLGLDLVESPDFGPHPPGAITVNPSFLKDVLAAPFVSDGRLLLALGDPEESAALDGVRAASSMDLDPVIVPASAVEAALAGWYPDDQTRAGEADWAGNGEDEGDIDHLRDLASEAPVVKLVNELVADALERRASDIHIEPYRDVLRFRLRIDGVLVDIDAPSASLSRLITSRIKIMAGLDIAERRKPQDGRARIAVSGRALDLRIATAPTAHGESVAIRILEDSSTCVRLDDLGFTVRDLSAMTRALTAPHGLILVTGPTGAGKTTTLAAAVSHLNAPDRKIISIEDPVEYQIEGVNQIAVRPAIGLTFAAVLRSVLRHDPDVIVVGEMRDAETAEIAINAALTGHLVIATLHANTAAGAVPRLIDMGVDPALIRSNLRLVLAQRLVRELCAACAVPSGTGAVIAGVNRADLPVHHAPGCAKCGDLGYRGRLGLFELIEPDTAFLDAIRPGVSTGELEAIARQSGTPSLLDDVFAKVASGRTTPEEAVRVLGG